MTNSVSTQVLADGPVNFILRLNGTLDTANITNTLLVNPSTLGFSPSGVVLEDVNWTIDPPLTVQLWWDATTPVLLDSFAASGRREKTKRYAGIWNNAGAGKTGNVLYSTEGWTGVVTFDLMLQFRKVGLPY